MESSTLLFIISLYFISDNFSNAVKIWNQRVKRYEDTLSTNDMNLRPRRSASAYYPNLGTIPNTSFQCEDQLYEGGLYADVETGCQVYHVCHDGRKDSFLCGGGTIFNQQILTCDYSYNAECENSPNYYYVNSQIGNHVSSHNPEENNADFKRYNQHSGDSNNHESNYPSYSKFRGDAGEANGQNPQQCQSLKKIVNTSWLFPKGTMTGTEK